MFNIIQNGQNGEMYFGHQVATSRPNNEDTFYTKYSLKLRPYLGPTSTDHELAMLMAN